MRNPDFFSSGNAAPHSHFIIFPLASASTRRRALALLVSIFFPALLLGFFDFKSIFCCPVFHLVSVVLFIFPNFICVRFSTSCFQYFLHRLLASLWLGFLSLNSIFFVRRLFWKILCPVSFRYAILPLGQNHESHSSPLDPCIELT